MDVNAFNAIKTYNTAKNALNPAKVDGLATPSERQELKPGALVQEMVSAVAKSESAASAFMTGKADPHSVVEAVASAELAVETAVTLRNRVVEAYQELLRMPV